MLELDEYISGKDTVGLAAAIITKARKYREQGFNVHIGVDAIGIGEGVCDQLRDKEFDVQEIRWGMVDDEWYKKKFVNQRAEAHSYIKLGILDRRISLPDNPKLFKQRAYLLFEYNEQGKLKMLPKPRMWKMDIPSPDLSDSLAMAMLISMITNYWQSRIEGQEEETLRMIHDAYPGEYNERGVHKDFAIFEEDD